MTDLERWVAAFESMDAKRRRSNLRAMEAMAMAFPARKPAKLTLITRGATGLTSGGRLNKDQNLLPRVGVARIVQLK